MTISTFANDPVHERLRALAGRLRPMPDGPPRYEQTTVGQLFGDDVHLLGEQAWFKIADLQLCVLRAKDRRWPYDRYDLVRVGDGGRDRTAGRVRRPRTW